MQIPPEIGYHNVDKSDFIDAQIREHIDKLDRLFDRLITVRARVEAVSRQHRTGNLYTIHIEIGVPGKDLVVSQEPHHPGDKYHNADLRTAVRDAFAAAERQLIEYKRQLNGGVKPHETEFLGQVTQIDPANDHGFLLTKEGTQLYFHRNSLITGDFDKLKRGDSVHYVEAMGDTGPTAKKVWLAEGR